MEKVKPDFLDSSIFDLVNAKAKALEDLVRADVIFYHGAIDPGYFRSFRDFVEDVKAQSNRTDDAVALVLRTPGGVAETTESMVNVLRGKYRFLYCVVPDAAMSAGTILSMAADKIYMDYASSLGPIDPQVPASDTGHLVPALGYLDKVAEISSKPNLMPADVIFLKTIDLAKLALFEQARNLSVDLLKDWLVKYKFKDWNVHRTTNPGTPVTPEEKSARAEEIATALSNHKKWRSHGRNLNVAKLKELRIDIDDYTNDPALSGAIRSYNDPLTGYVDRLRLNFFMHNHRLPN